MDQQPNLRNKFKYLPHWVLITSRDSSHPSQALVTHSSILTMALILQPLESLRPVITLLCRHEARDAYLLPWNNTVYVIYDHPGGSGNLLRCWWQGWQVSQKLHELILRNVDSLSTKLLVKHQPNLSGFRVEWWNKKLEVKQRHR